MSISPAGILRLLRIRGASTACTLALLSVIGLNGCADTGGSSGGYAVRDSAGITIAENTRQPSSLAAVWFIDSLPMLRIGSVGGAPETQFSSISSALLMENGDIVVANREPMEIRVFDAEGNFLHKYGRRGEGPGEFGSLSQLYAGAGDTVIALNHGVAPSLMRFSTAIGYVDSRMLYRDSITSALPTGMRLAEGGQSVFPNGAVIQAAVSGQRPNYNEVPAGETFRPTSNAVWISADRTRSIDLGAVPDLEQLYVDTPSRRRVLIPLASRSSERASSPASPSRHCIGLNNSPDIHCVDEDGKRLTIRWLQDAAPVAQHEKDAWAERTRESARRPGSTTTPADAERMIEAGLIHDDYPPLRGMLLAADRSILVATSDLGAVPNSPLGFRVFSPAGELLGTVFAPASLRPMFVGRDKVVGVVLDDDGVEYIVVHRLRREPG